MDAVLSNWIRAAPRGEATTALARLDGAEQEIKAKLAELDREQRAAGDDVARLSAALTDLEAHAARGEPVAAKERTALEQQLAAARGRAAQPWAERRAALLAVGRERRKATEAYTVSHFGVLLDEVEANASLPSAARVDAAAAEVLAAAAERAAAARLVETLVTLVRGRTAFGDVPPSRSDALAREAERLRGQGGERPPLLRPELRGDADDVDEAPDIDEAPDVVEPAPAAA